MELEKHISDLLLKHTCVIVPGFGGFISQRKPSSFNNNGKLIPPQKSIFFNSNLQNDDGLLIGSYAISKKVAYKVAFQDVLRIVSYWKRKIATGHRIEIDGVGYLYQGENGKIRFEQESTINLLSSSYGLPVLTDLLLEDVIIPTPSTENELAFIPNQIETLETIDESSPEYEDKIHSETKSPFRWVRYAAAIFLLPILFYSVWIPVKTDFLESHLISWNDINPFNQQPNVNFTSTEIKANAIDSIPLNDIAKTIETSTVENNYAFELDENSYKNIPIHKDVIKTKVDEATDTDMKAVETPTFSSSDEYHYFLIGNCFQVLDNATAFVKDMKINGIDAEIIDQVNGLYRVSIGKAHSSEQLQPIKSQLTEKGITNFWILNK